jgi:hypothetical protein
VAEHDSLGVAKPGAHPLETTARRTGIVNQPDPQPLDHDHQARRQRRPNLVVVNVAVHPHDLSVLPQFAQHAQPHEVARVQDQLGRTQPPRAFIGKPPPSPGQVRIRDDRDFD